MLGEEGDPSSTVGGTGVCTQLSTGLASQVHSLDLSLKKALFSAVSKMFFLGQASTGF